MDDAFAKELTLRQEMSQLEAEAEEAIAVEDARLDSLEATSAVASKEVLDLPPAPGGDLALSPFTWSAGDGLEDRFWDPSTSVPWVVATGSN